MPTDRAFRTRLRSGHQAFGGVDSGGSGGSGGSAGSSAASVSAGRGASSPVRSSSGSSASAVVRRGLVGLVVPGGLVWDHLRRGHGSRGVGGGRGAGVPALAGDPDRLHGGDHLGRVRDEERRGAAKPADDDDQDADNDEDRREDLGHRDPEERPVVGAQGLEAEADDPVPDEEHREQVAGAQAPAEAAGQDIRPRTPSSPASDSYRKSGWKCSPSVAFGSEPTGQAYWTIRWEHWIAIPQGRFVGGPYSSWLKKLPHRATACIANRPGATMSAHSQKLCRRRRR